MAPEYQQQQDGAAPREIPLRAKLYRYQLTHTELATLQAMLEGNSTGEFNFLGLNRVAAFSKLSRKTIQNTINGRWDRKGKRVLGLIEKRVLVVIAPSNAASRKPTTYRIQLEALKPDPRVEKYLIDKRQMTLAFTPQQEQLAKWRQHNQGAWAAIIRDLNSASEASVGAKVSDEQRTAAAIAIAQRHGMPRGIAQFLFLSQRPGAHNA